MIPQECKWVSAQIRSIGTRAKRTKDATDPRIPTSDEPTSSLRPSMAGDEPAAASETEAESAKLKEGEESEEVEDVPEDREIEGAGGSSGSRDVIAPATDDSTAPRRAQRSDVGTEHAVQPAHAEAGTQATDDTDWTSFDLSRSIQELRSAREGTVRRCLRKLHIRWFHISTRRMVELLRRAEQEFPVRYLN